MIKTASVCLSVIGAFWAFVAIPGLFAPFDIASSLLNDAKINKGMITLSLLAYSGYFIWFGWIARALNMKYFIKGRAFWVLSTLHHLAWLTLTLRSYFEQESYSTGLFLFEYLFVTYPGIVAVISAYFAYMEGHESEPAGAGQLDNPPVKL